MNKQHRTMARKQKGFTLIEMMIVLTVAGILVGLIVVKGKDLLDEKSAENVAAALNDAKGKLQKRYRQWGSYTGLDNTACYTGNIFPTTWKSTTADQFVNDFGDNNIVCAAESAVTTLSGQAFAGANKFFSITMSGFGEYPCQVVANAVVQSYDEVQINGTRVTGDDVITTQCATSPATLTLIGR